MQTVLLGRLIVDVVVVDQWDLSVRLGGDQVDD